MKFGHSRGEAGSLDSVSNESESLTTEIVRVLSDSVGTSDLDGRAGPQRRAAVWLYACGALQAAALSYRSRRAERWNIDPRDIDSYTLEDLATWIRPHPGSAGQAFELQVADALNAGVPAMQNAVRESLDAHGIAMATPQALVMGLEKIRYPSRFLVTSADVLEGRRLVTGRPGRPPEAQKALARVLDSGSSITASKGALAFSDILVYDGSGECDLVVPTSVKIRGLGFRPRPETEKMLWIVGWRGPALKWLPASAMVVVVGDHRMGDFQAGHNGVLRGLEAIDRPSLMRRPPYSRSSIVRFLVSKAHSSVKNAVDGLLDTAADLLSELGWEGAAIAGPDVSPNQLEIEVAETPQEFNKYEEERTETGLVVMTRKPLITMHRQFFESARVGA